MGDLNCHTRHTLALPAPPEVVPPGTPFREWYPGGRAGEIIRELEQATDWAVIRGLLAEKIAIDRGRA